MSFEQQSEQLEQTYEKYVILTLRQLIGLLQVTIPFITNFSKQNPTLFLLGTTFILLYVTWKILKNLFNIIKKLFYFYMAVLAVSIYLRGWDQFINADVPYLYNTVLTTNNAYKVGTVLKFFVVQLKFYLNFLYQYVNDM